MPMMIMSLYISVILHQICINFQNIPKPGIPLLGYVTVLECSGLKFLYTSKGQKYILLQINELMFLVPGFLEFQHP